MNKWCTACGERFVVTCVTIYELGAKPPFAPRLHVSTHFCCMEWWSIDRHHLISRLCDSGLAGDSLKNLLIQQMQDERSFLTNGCQTLEGVDHSRNGWIKAHSFHFSRKLKPTSAAQESKRHLVISLLVSQECCGICVATVDLISEWLSAKLHVSHLLLWVST